MAPFGCLLHGMPPSAHPMAPTGAIMAPTGAIMAPSAPQKALLFGYNGSP